MKARRADADDPSRSWNWDEQLPSRGDAHIAPEVKQQQKAEYVNYQTLLYRMARRLKINIGVLETILDGMVFQHDKINQHMAGNMADDSEEW